MAVEPKLLFDLFDSYWFTHPIFNKTENPPTQIPQNKEPVPEITQNLDVPTKNLRCYSEQLLTNIPNNSLHLHSPKLETIFSGKEVQKLEDKKITLRVKEKIGRKRNMKSKSKSLSELEFEEVKGFMDLGFKFSEKDKDSSLVSIIPGLQRLGKDEEEEQVNFYEDVARPYLSEAWDDLEEATRLVTIPVQGSDSDVKDQLRFWAHSVASSVVIR